MAAIRRTQAFIDPLPGASQGNTATIAIEGPVSKKPSLSYDYVSNCCKAFIGESRYAVLSRGRLAFYHTMADAKKGTLPIEVMTSKECKCMRVMGDLIEVKHAKTFAVTTFASARPEKAKAWLEALIKEGFPEPHVVPYPTMAAWKGEAEGPVIQSGWLEFEFKDTKIKGFTYLLQERMISWSQEDAPKNGVCPEGCVNLKDVIGVEAITGGFALNKGSQKVRAFASDPEECRKWLGSLFLATTSAEEPTSLNWKPTEKQVRPWQDAALRSRLAPKRYKGARKPAPRSSATPSAKAAAAQPPSPPPAQTEEPTDGEGEATEGEGEVEAAGEASSPEQASEAIDAVDDAAAAAAAAPAGAEGKGEAQKSEVLCPQYFDENFRATAVIMCQNLKAAAFHNQGKDWKTFLRDLSKDRYGFVGWEEFSTLCLKSWRLPYRSDHLRACFDALDDDCCEAVDVEDLIKFIDDPVPLLQKRQGVTTHESGAGSLARSVKLRNLFADLLASLSYRMRLASSDKDLQQVLEARASGEASLSWEPFLAACKEDFSLEDGDDLLVALFRSLDGPLVGAVPIAELAAFVENPALRIHNKIKDAAAVTGAAQRDGVGFKRFMKGGDSSAKMDWTEFRSTCVRKLRIAEDDSQLWLVFRALDVNEQGTVLVSDLVKFMESGEVPESPVKESSAPKINLEDQVVYAGKKGVAKYVGLTHFGKGEYVGIELIAPDGKNDGTVDDKTYFTCKADHGIFARITQVQLLEAAKAEEHPELSIKYKTAEDAKIGFQELQEAGGFAWGDRLIVALTMTHGSTGAPEGIQIPVSRNWIDKETLSTTANAEALGSLQASTICCSVEKEDAVLNLELMVQSSNCEDLAKPGSFKVPVSKLTPARWQLLRRHICAAGGERAAEMEAAVFYEPARVRSATKNCIQVKIEGAAGNFKKIEGDKIYCMVCAQNSKDWSRRSQAVSGEEELKFEFETTLADFDTEANLTFTLWRQRAGQWDTCIARGVMKAEEAATGFDGDFALNDVDGIELGASLKATVSPRSEGSAKPGLLRITLGDLYLTRSKEYRARSPSPAHPCSTIRINTSRQEAALQMQGPHAAFLLPPGERSMKGGYHKKDFPVVDKVHLHEIAGQQFYARLNTGRCLLARPGDSTTGVADSVHQPAEGRSIGTYRGCVDVACLPAPDLTAAFKVTGNSSDPRSGFYFPQSPQGSDRLDESPTRSPTTAGMSSPFSSPMGSNRETKAASGVMLFRRPVVA
mmetsp:Transcript_35497/g.75673  ORF Transcript_35497/g.75673 Transcript_35497/m.75673 type:complete len:1249 (-) Transcript_35497:337-4083(-)